MRYNVSTSRLGNVGGCCYDADYGRRPPAHDGCPSERSSIRTLIRTSNRRESRSRDDKHAPAYRCGHNISTNTGCRIQSILSSRKAGCHRSGQPCMVTYLPTGNNTRLKAMAERYHFLFTTRECQYFNRMQIFQIFHRNSRNTCKISF